MNQTLTAAIVASLAGGGIVGAILSFIRDVRAQRAAAAKIPVEIDSTRMADLVRQVEIVERVNERVAKHAHEADEAIAEARREATALRLELGDARAELEACRKENVAARIELEYARKEIIALRRQQDP